MARLARDAWHWVVVVLLAMTVVLTFLVARLSHNVDQLGDEVDSIRESSTRTEQSADEIVKFVHQVQAEVNGTQTEDAVNKLITVICASSDPVRVVACSQLKPGG